MDFEQGDLFKSNDLLVSREAFGPLGLYSQKKEESILVQNEVSFCYTVKTN